MPERFVILSTDCSNVARCMRPVKSATMQKCVRFAELKRALKSLQTDTNNDRISICSGLFLKGVHFNEG